MSARVHAYLIPYTWHPTQGQPYFLLPVVVETSPRVCRYTLSMLGGRCQPKDETLVGCILREVCEETGTVLDVSKTYRSLYPVSWTAKHPKKGRMHITVFFAPISNEIATFEEPPAEQQWDDLKNVAKPLQALWHLNQRVNSHPYRNVTTMALKETDAVRKKAAEKEIEHIRNVCSEFSFTAIFSYQEILAADLFDATGMSFEFDAAKRRRRNTQAWEQYRDYRSQEEVNTCLWLELGALIDKFRKDPQLLKDLENEHYANASSATDMIATTVAPPRECHCRMPTPTRNGYYR